MAIPGYDQDDIVERTLEGPLNGHDGDEPEATAGDRSGDDSGEPPSARVSIAAADVPGATTLVESDEEAPPGALADPVELYALGDVGGLEALALEVRYDPGRLPPGASPTDVAIAVDTGDGFEPLESTTDLEATTVTATLTEEPPGTVVVPVTTYDREVPEDESPRE